MGRVTGRAFSDALLVLAHWSGNSNLSVARGRGWVIDRTCGRMVEGPAAADVCRRGRRRT